MCEMKINQLIETALWSSLALGSSSEDSHFDSLGFTIYDLTPEAHARLMSECEQFCRKALAAGIPIHDFEDWQHDFWLTRNGHGAGFWDGDYEKNIGQKLTDISHSFGEVYLYLNDENRIEVIK
jgi:hypothetical protein